jgi:glycine cleavage system aminomethyltransferase T
MSVSDSRPDSTPSGAEHLLDELDGLQADAGAVLAYHRGRPVAVSYGSAAGELAACLNAVGIASCAELTKLELTAPGQSLDRVLTGLLGVQLLPGGIHQTRAVGWYRPDDGRLIALCEADQGERLRGRLEFWTLRDPALALQDRTDDWAAIAVIGRRTRLLLGELGVYGPGGDPRGVPPVTRTADDPGTSWLLHTDDDALAITPRASAPALWQRITRTGRPWQICAVGHEALLRYRMLTRLACAR